LLIVALPQPLLLMPALIRMIPQTPRKPSQAATLRGDTSRGCSAATHWLLFPRRQRQSPAGTKAAHRAG
jgi:hypothetical protein